ncbi:A/G-specific adenine glycosylase [Pseudokineococcus lusitanus]|uniref:A/G-specific adenine glycosylase n=1 Tax=Pseudokineococcus lusitanus TaxID=763993 RepID=UPI0018F7AC7A
MPDDLDGLHAAVLRWYAEHARDLPWRRPGASVLDDAPSAPRTAEEARASAWGVLVSEVMLQQTPVVRVEPVWREWMARWPTPAALTAVPAGEAVRAWGRLGYPRRALRLHAAAVALVERHDGVVPEDADALRALPGVGAYTAAAVASFAHGQRHAVVDTNVRRVHARLVTGAAQPAPALTAAETALAVALLPATPRAAAGWAVAVMELGALVCTARAPRCGACPVADRCAWQAAGAPPAEGPPRRGQAWEGTDRQVRGRLLAVLREATAPVATADLEVAVPAPDDARRAQRERCLASLLADGLVERDDDRWALPG